MCEFCKDGDITEICEKDVDFGLLGDAVLSLDISENYIYANLCGNGYCGLEVEVKKPIKFCPFCGRKLSEVSE